MSNSGFTGNRCSVLEVFLCYLISVLQSNDRFYVTHLSRINGLNIELILYKKGLLESSPFPKQ